MARINLRNRIRKLPAFRKLVIWSKQTTLPGFGGIPIYVVINFFFQELKKESLIVRANAMAFSFFLSLFPSLIFLFTLLPYLPIDDLIVTFKRSIQQVMPSQGAEYLFLIIDQVTSIPRGGLLSLGLLLAIFFASNGIQTMLRGFYKSYEVSYKIRSGLQTRWVSIRLTLFLGVLLICSLILIVIGRGTLDHLLIGASINWVSGFSLIVLRWVVLLALYYAGLSIIYRYGPALKRRVKFFSPGTTLATTLSIASSIAFSFYVSKFNTYDRVYGSLGALIVMMLWLQINSLILLIGYELNASIAINRDRMKAMLNDDLEKA